MCAGRHESQEGRRVVIGGECGKYIWNVLIVKFSYSTFQWHANIMISHRLPFQCSLTVKKYELELALKISLFLQT